MDPATINALVNMGSAGAVIAVVLIFLKSIRERDAEWRSFFTTLNTNNKDDVQALAATMERMVKALDAHDEQAKGIARAIDGIGADVELIKDRTQPLPRAPRAK